jgi:hypothetical protein
MAGTGGDAVVVNLGEKKCKGRTKIEMKEG